MQPFTEALVRHAPERMLWGSDWPHVQQNDRKMPNDGDLVDLFAEWVPDEAHARPHPARQPAAAVRIASARACLAGTVCRWNRYSATHDSSSGAPIAQNTACGARPAPSIMPATVGLKVLPMRPKATAVPTPVERMSVG